MMSSCRLSWWYGVWLAAVWGMCGGDVVVVWRGWEIEGLHMVFGMPQLARQDPYPVPVMQLACQVSGHLRATQM